MVASARPMFPPSSLQRRISAGLAVAGRGAGAAVNRLNFPMSLQAALYVEEEEPQNFLFRLKHLFLSLSFEISDLKLKSLQKGRFHKTQLRKAHISCISNLDIYF